MTRPVVVHLHGQESFVFSFNIIAYIVVVLHILRGYNSQLV
jgi:hypothetical protein